MNYCTHLPVSNITTVDRIIVLGDIHGDWAALQRALRVGRVIDSDGKWIGASTHVVQVGDLLDRGGRSGAVRSDEGSERKIFRYLLALRRAAREYGGDVHLLLGNHELMNVSGDFRYVSPLGLIDYRGHRGRRAAFRPGGSEAKAMACHMNSVLQIGSWVFSHAGITPRISKTYSLETVNNMVREYLLGNREFEDGIRDMFWHRGYGTEAACPAVSEALGQWQAKNMAIGHTVQTGGITSICSGGLWRVDVGMSGAFGADRKIEVLEILNDGETVRVLREAN